MRVLVTDGSYKHTLGVVRQLGRQHQVVVASERRAATAGVSKFAYRSLVSPPANHADAFLGWLNRVICEYRIEQVVPVGPVTGELLARHRTDWMPTTRIVVAAPEKMALALDKVAVAHVAAEVGVPVPRARQPESLDDLECVAAEVGYPLVIKPAIEGLKGVAYVDEPQHLRGAFDRYLRRYKWSSPSLPLLQRRIVGPGFGVFATYQAGRCRRLSAHRRVREWPATGGQSTCAELFDDWRLLELGQRILDALEWHGVAMVEFKQDAADGTYYLIEVNPKFWGSLDLDLAAGADFVGDLLAIGAGQELDYVPPPSGELRFCWPLYGDLRHLIERPRAWRAVISDWFNPGVRTNVVWSDPLPHAIELALTCRWLVFR